MGIIVFLRKTILYRWWKALKAQIALMMYGNAAQHMTVIGVTGTNGKTTTCTLVHHLLSELGHKTVYIGTTGVFVGGEELKGVKKMTSYDPIALHRLLALAWKAGCTHAVLEVSSHGLHQKRFAHIPFHVGVLTNITPEHLDYHGTMEEYAKQKQKLFRMVQQTRGVHSVAVLPTEDQWGKRWIDRMQFAQTITYGIQGVPALQALAIETGSTETRLSVRYLGKTMPVVLPMVGEFNVKNMLAAIGVLLGLGHTLDEVVPVLAEFTGVVGRQEHHVSHGVDWYIDYAHTPDGLHVMLTYLQKLKGTGKVITVFGAPGERDKAKRPVMGKTVADMSDVVIVTDDDPARENRWEILRDVAAGVERKLGEDFWIIPQRADAITHAARIAEPGDIVLLAGIGHQDVLVTNFGYVPWSEKEAIEKAYTQIGLSDIAHQ